ncbi:MAG: NAD-dependent epimerase/dehydratase family protein [Drouetiella hepatica Uher 2000/2452]|jgi:nucleoside-diphosphate-sugar epimerase|uniref:NAD-dependent epimerase/dehydratase family protein n=1 Tax=Drouetiella hepatica Uher 2000/2452 TaxID=904376 RepID=A0A951Q746_9CYAN|nr:NAD-dependent epimerase/dehydratase family protein [Drouetiella hepatica Uher 2000/2452]
MKSELHVIFGTGSLAQAVMRELLTHDVRIRMVNRSGQAAVPESVEVVAADGYDLQSTGKAMQGAAVVYQCAQPAYTQWQALFPKLQASIMQAAAVNGAKLIVGDNLYMYGAVDCPMHEALPNAATTRKGRTRAQMAEALLSAHQQGLVRVAIARGSDFYGPGVLGSVMGDRVFPAVLAGKTAAAVGNLDLPHTYTFIDDFGKALVALAEREEALGQIWHVPNAETVTTRQFLTLAFEEAGHSPKMDGMGKFMMRLAGVFIPEARETVEMMYEFEQPFVVDHTKYVEAFGNHATPLRTAIRGTLEWYRKQGK